METNVKFVSTHTDQEEAARLLSKYDFLALPVVDAEERLVGIVTVDDAMDVMQEEATEDMERMAAMAPSDKPYMKVSIFENWKKRAPWLLFLMISATFTGSIITHFETALAANLVLSSFIPMLMSTGGNTGSQASTTIIRSLSLGEIRYRDIPRILLKECGTAILCGVTLAVVNFAKLMLIDRVGVMVSIVVCLTILAVALVANLVGSLMMLYGVILLILLISWKNFQLRSSQRQLPQGMKECTYEFDEEEIICTTAAGEQRYSYEQVFAVVSDMAWYVIFFDASHGIILDLSLIHI